MGLAVRCWPLIYFPTSITGNMDTNIYDTVSPETNWQIIRETVTSPENKGVHKWYDWEQGWAYITTPNMQRLKITPEHSYKQVYELLADVRRMIQTKTPFNVQWESD